MWDVRKSCIARSFIGVAIPGEGLEWLLCTKWLEPVHDEAEKLGRDIVPITALEDDNPSFSLLFSVFLFGMGSCITITLLKSFKF